MNKKKSTILKAIILSVILMDLIPQKAYAMHIAEGYLQPKWCLFWAILSLPFVIVSFFKIKKKVLISNKHLVLFAMSGAFAFVLSALKIPSVTGSSSHPTGVGLGAILFGPMPMVLIGLIILLFQAILLAHGGISTLGANTFSMAIAGPLVSYGIFKLFKKLGIKNTYGVFFAAALGNLATYVVTSIQLSLAFPGENFMGSMVKFLSIFAVTQIPLAICEGILTVIIYNILEKYNKKELKELEEF